MTQQLGELKSEPECSIQRAGEISNSEGTNRVPGRQRIVYVLDIGK